MTDWSELDTRGFVVVRGFFTPEDCAVLRTDFEQGAPPTAYPHGFKLLGRSALAHANPKIEAMLADIRASTAFVVDTVNFLTLSHYITTSLVERTSYFHQDFDLDYKLTRDHIDYLNFWVPVAKPDPAKSNVVVIPFDTLRARSQEAYDALVGSGGHRLIRNASWTDVFGNYGGILDERERTRELVLDFSIDDLAETPLLAQGDLLIMRGDLIHRTQDASTPRVAASMRATASTKKIAKERVDVPDPASTDPAAKMYAMIQRCFMALGRDEVTVGELVAFARGSR
ncbi:MAG TPA: hypothetical protein VGM90_31290 [Kofleriaceae bacterium]|jgi:hypothetical protein